jgi:hypothetical protein
MPPERFIVSRNRNPVDAEHAPVSVNFGLLTINRPSDIDLNVINGGFSIFWRTFSMALNVQSEGTGTPYDRQVIPGIR